MIFILMRYNKNVIFSFTDLLKLEEKKTDFRSQKTLEQSFFANMGLSSLFREIIALKGKSRSTKIL